MGWGADGGGGLANTKQHNCSLKSKIFDLLLIKTALLIL